MQLPALTVSILRHYLEFTPDLATLELWRWLDWTGSRRRYYHSLIMASERIQRWLERLLNQIDEAKSQGDWESVRALAQDVLEIDAGNIEATAYLRSAHRRLDGELTTANIQPHSAPASPPTVRTPATSSAGT